MSKKQLASKLMFIGGIAELVVALLHFLMPFQLARAGEIVELSHNYRSFVLLATIAIGLCMTVFGALSIYFSNKLLLGEESAWIFGLSQGALWAGRMIFELILPVRIPLFFLTNPTVLIVALATLLALLFLVPPVAFRAQLLTKA
jgi:ABC-type cobalamin transport system permease subunit